MEDFSIPKSGDSKDPHNYRPISLLPILSKFLEHHFYEQKIISDCQWGFTRNRSTTTALLSLTHEWHMHMENAI